MKDTIALLDNNIYSRQELLEKMENDEFYYGEMGRLALSSSAVGKLLKSPKAYLQMLSGDDEDTKALRIGRFAHQCVLEPDKFKNIYLTDCKTAGANEYKSAVAEYGPGGVILPSEYDEVVNIANALADSELSYIFFEDVAENEIPGLKNLFSMPFRAKADRLSYDFVTDLKTTSDIFNFERSAQKFNYDSQAFIYREIFGRPVRFVVVDKKTYDVGYYECSDAFYESGHQKVLEAICVYNDYIANDVEFTFKGVL